VNGSGAQVNRIDELALLHETVGAALIRLSREDADRPAVMWATDRGVADGLTYSELQLAALGVAATLLDINPDRRRVALAALNSVDWIVAMYGCALAGMSVVPVSASGAVAELRYQIEHARVGVVLAAKSAGTHSVLDDVTKLVDSLPTAVLVRDIGAVRSSDSVALPEVSPESEFLVQFTSGTTGHPKAASISHRAALNAGEMFGRVWHGDSGTRLLNPLPLHHVGGSVTGLITSLAIGGTYTLIERFSPQAVIDALRQIRPTVAGMVPTMMIDLLNLPGVTPADFASLQAVVGGATAVDPTLVAEMEEQLGVRVIGSYGQSEAPAMLATAPEDPVHIRMATIGRCLPGRAVAIRDEAGDVLPTNTDGELCVRGPVTMTGYLRDDGSLDTAIDSDGWRRTGDVCSMDDDGLVTFRGRTRDVIIRGGLNVYPAEVEQALSVHESVAEVAVFGIPDSRFGETVVAALLPAPGGSVDVAALKDIAAEHLSSYKRPEDWVVVAELPRTSTGKVRKHVLQESYGRGMLGSVGTNRHLG
jgi:acyl-CoA synthetase (AMP-forming)/AMP-acid ligase II